MSGKYDLAVAYRIYPRVSKIPALHPDDKFALADLCLRSFRASLGNLRVKIFALLDQCPPEYESLFLDHFDAGDLELIRLNDVGNQSSFQRQVELLLNQNDAEAIYFAEDDYFYRGSFAPMLEFLQRPGVDFISPYDHPDYYSLPLHPRAQRVEVDGSQHWRTAASTCMTFLTTRQTLARAKKIFETYFTGNLDVSLWMSLTKQTVENPATLWNLFCARKTGPFWHYTLQSWRRGWRQILFGRKFCLWTPVPSIATHVEKAFLAPAIEWHILFQKNFTAYNQPAATNS
jgi:hypothetical protein